MATKICTVCKQNKELSAYWLRTVGGKSYPTSYCKVCRNQKRRDRIRSGEWKSSANFPSAGLASERQREYRQDPAKRAAHILVDSRRSDKKKSLQNDLTREFIDQQIAQPCSYCEANDLRMTLDRIDNTIGHIKANVVPACYRCNIVRGNMPYEAWLILAPSMKVARESGLFGDWGSQPMARRKQHDRSQDPR